MVGRAGGAWLYWLLMDWRMSLIFLLSCDLSRNRPSCPLENDWTWEHWVAKVIAVGWGM